jgi:hypothetical protein
MNSTEHIFSEMVIIGPPAAHPRKLSLEAVNADIQEKRKICLLGTSYIWVQWAGLL